MVEAAMQFRFAASIGGKGVRGRNAVKFSP
jgi:hypothetical protein